MYIPVTAPEVSRFRTGCPQKKLFLSRFLSQHMQEQKNAAIVLHSPEISVTTTHPSPRLYPTSSNAHPSPLLPYTREAEQKPEEPEKPRVGLVRPTGKENTGGGTVS